MQNCHSGHACSSHMRLFASNAWIDFVDNPDRWQRYRTTTFTMITNDESILFLLFSSTSRELLCNWHTRLVDHRSNKNEWEEGWMMCTHSGIEWTRKRPDIWFDCNAMNIEQSTLLLAASLRTMRMRMMTPHFVWEWLCEAVNRNGLNDV